jgi:hypothetical protein
MSGKQPGRGSVCRRLPNARGTWQKADRLGCNTAADGGPIVTVGGALGA